MTIFFKSSLTLLDLCYLLQNVEPTNYKLIAKVQLCGKESNLSQGFVTPLSCRQQHVSQKKEKNCDQITDDVFILASTTVQDFPSVLTLQTFKFTN